MAVIAGMILLAGDLQIAASIKLNVLPAQVGAVQRHILTRFYRQIACCRHLTVMVGDAVTVHFSTALACRQLNREAVLATSKPKTNTHAVVAAARGGFLGTGIF